ncbi:MAG: cytochrome c biogenesis protein CcdA [Treponema sp.]|nr:cytochrome c biogenesis protein CcdA [Treponema sp.]
MLVSTLFFIVGFSIVFIVLSIVLSGFMFFLSGINTIINYAAGIIVIILGLNIMFNFIPFLNYEKRLHPERPHSLTGALLAGIAFGAGWTPCIGPILGSILLMASQDGALLPAIICLIVYSAGLGLPFLAAAFFWGAFIRHLAKLKSILPLISRISGVFIIGIGIFIFTGRFSALNSFFLKSGYALASWSKSGGPHVRFLPALVFLIIALFPPVLRIIKKRPVFSYGIIVFSGLFLILAIAQAANILNCMDLLAGWFMFIGV